MEVDLMSNTEIAGLDTQQTGNEFIAAILKAQGGECNCEVCQILRKMAQSMITKAIGGQSAAGS